MRNTVWFFAGGVAVGGIVGVCLAMSFLATGILGSFPSVPTDRWQAVFLENGQVYFGKLTDHTSEYVVLSDVFYLRYASELAEAGEKNLNLVKLGGELHGPEDTLFLRKGAILFWENLKPDSRIVKTILSARN